MQRGSVQHGLVTVHDSSREVVDRLISLTAHPSAHLDRLIASPSSSHRPHDPRCGRHPSRTAPNPLCITPAPLFSSSLFFLLPPERNNPHENPPKPLRVCAGNPHTSPFPRRRWPMGNSMAKASASPPPFLLLVIDSWTSLPHSESLLHTSILIDLKHITSHRSSVSIYF